MGKRRDRRQQASSRKVKLDLSIDDVVLPSGTPGSQNDLDSTLGEEVKAGSENQEIVNANPLSLLGQYSDEEADEDGFDPGSLQDADSEANKDIQKDETEQVTVENNQVMIELSFEEKEERSANDAGSSHQTSTEVLISNIEVKEVIPENEWQSVLDDHSGEYYYWNVRTGETTWVNPFMRVSADEPDSTATQLEDLGPSSTEIAEQFPSVQTDTKDDERVSSNGETRSSPENTIQHPDTVSLVVSTDTELHESDAALIVGNNDQADDLLESKERIEDAGDPESTACSVASPLNNQCLAGEVRKNEEENVISETNEREGTPEIQHDQSGTESSPKSSPAPVERTQSLEGVQDASVCARNSLPIVVIRTISEDIACFVEKLELFLHQLSQAIREFSTGASRHVYSLSQTEARLNDWKVLCRLNFVPEACLSFMQKELLQLEKDMTIGEIGASDKLTLKDPTTIFDASHKEKHELTESDQPLNCANYQNIDIVVSKPLVQPTENVQKADNVEDGEIQTSCAEILPAYGGMSEATAGVNVPNLSSGFGSEDVDMDVDMEVDEEIVAEPAVPGSDVPVGDLSVSYTYPYPHPGSTDTSTLTQLDLSAGQPSPYFHPGLSGYSWAPPLPPDDEWAPPPPGELEPAPPPPPDEPPPLPPQSPDVLETSSLFSMSSEPSLQYVLPEYSLENVSVLPNVSAVAEYQQVVDPSVYGAYVDGVVYSNSAQSLEQNPYVDGIIYSNSVQSTETLTIEQPYVITSGPTIAFNGWTPRVMIPTASSLSANPVSSEPPVKPVSHPSLVPAATSITTDSNVTGASLETKKQPIKAKSKKRTHAVAAAPMLNKKVSSLVNKWKQAKEELHGGEDEDDDKALYDVELLEKKRQKEIEEWRRQQIASGEALDNANFQPLGALDWRERVKRARKSDLKEGNEETTVSVDSSIVESRTVETMQSKKPNLTDLSQGLPSGWQAYWDETSGEVYYGNLTTQETTWDRPVT